ncbi:MAG: hypothetical protein ACOC1G_04240, partial [Phycisphaeraceae bacterium]
MATQPTPAAPENRPPRKWVRRCRRVAGVVAVVVLLLVLAVLAAGWYFTRSAQLIPRIASVLEQATGAEVTIERSEVSWRGGSVSIEGLRLSLPEDAKVLVPEAVGEAMDEVFTAERVKVRLDLASLRSGTLALRSIEADGPVLTVIEHEPTGHTNLELLQRARVREGPPPTLPETWPEVVLNDAKLRRATLRNGERRLLGELALAGGVAAATGRKGVYRLDLRTSETGTEADSLRLLGEIDMTRLTGAFELVNLDLSPMQRALLPAELRRVWDRLDPDGSLPRVQLRVSPRFSLTGNPVDVQAEMELEDLALSLPIDALYSARMTGVSGSLRLRDGRLHMSSLRGDVEGIRYTLKGWLDAATPGQRFDLNLSTERFHVPNLPTIIPALPSAIQRSYRRLSPSGEFRLEVNVARDGPDEPTQYDGRVEVLDATARYEKFPYPAESLEGLIRFSSESVIIERLTGNTPGGGTVDITGSITPPGDGARVEMTLKLRDVPLDDSLLAAMEPGHREAVDMLLHQPSLQRLRDDRLIRNPEDEGDAEHNEPQHNDPQDASERGGVNRSVHPTNPTAYPFRAGGLLNVDVDVFRPLGDDTRYLNTTTIYLDGLAGAFQYFPVPVTAHGGTVSFNRDKIEVRDVVAKTPDGATIRGEGIITGHDTNDGPITPDLRLTAEGGSVNELMLFALPEAQAAQIRKLQLHADVAAEARIFRDAEQDRIAFEVDGRLAEGRAQPFGSDVVFDAVRGGVRVHNDGFDLDAIRARLEDGELEINGAWRFVDADDAPPEPPAPDEGQPDRETPADITLRVRGKDIAIHEKLAGLLPADTRESVRKRISPLAPEGETDFHLSLARPVRNGATAPLDFALTLEPRRLAFNLHERRLDFRDVRGSIHYEDAGIEIDRLRASTDEGTFGVSGLIDLGGDAGVALSLDADCSTIGPVLRTAIPSQAMSVLDRLELAGGLATQSARLRITPGNENRNDEARNEKTSATSPFFRPDFREAWANARVLLAADLALDGVSADVGVPVEDLHGQAELRVRADGDTPRVSLRIDATRAKVLDRRLERTRLDV